MGLKSQRFSSNNYLVPSSLFHYFPWLRFVKMALNEFAREPKRQQPSIKSIPEMDRFVFGFCSWRFDVSMSLNSPSHGHTFVLNTLRIKSKGQWANRMFYESVERTISVCCYKKNNQRDIATVTTLMVIILWFGYPVVVFENSFIAQQSAKTTNASHFSPLW